jgi:uncharacterized membrane protein YkvA (DUF1232 family)
LIRPAAERVLLAISPDARGVLLRVLEEPLQSVDSLRSDVHTYLCKLEALDGQTEFLDLALARQVAARCQSLLDRAAGSEFGAVHRLVQAAVRYFVIDADAEWDLSSPIGFDDDAEVVELIAREIEGSQATE